MSRCTCLVPCICPSILACVSNAYIWVINLLAMNVAHRAWLNASPNLAMLASAVWKKLQEIYASMLLGEGDGQNINVNTNRRYSQPFETEPKTWILQGKRVKLPPININQLGVVRGDGLRRNRCGKLFSKAKPCIEAVLASAKTYFHCYAKPKCARHASSKQQLWFWYVLITLDTTIPSVEYCSTMFYYVLLF